jgi:hypothetical protein
MVAGKRGKLHNNRETEKEMKEALKVIGIGILVLVAIVGLAWIIQGNDWFMYKVFAPKYEQTRRETFEQSRAFNQGMVQELENMRFEYTREKDPNAKKALADIILHRVAGYNLDDPAVSYDLRSFINDLKRQAEQGQ